MFKYLIGVSIVFLVLNACQHKPILPPPPNNNNPIDTSSSGLNPCSPDTIYFKNDIYPIITSNCTMSGCHNATDKADGIKLVDYNSIIKDGNIVAGDLDESKLYREIIETDPDKRMPLNLPALSSTDIDKIRKWILQGALNNECTDCDTSMAMSYTSHITPIINANCKGCHNSANPSAGIDVTTYNTLKTIVDNGKLLGVIAHQIGYSPMPKNGSKLSDCNIAKITKWINNGAPNN
jgi:hypothetical protein